VRVVLLLSKSDETTMRDVDEVGATAWIMKPFKEAQLLAVIKRVVGG
jgi:two-component system, chemotaxis family, chemotaxis protein CheY